MEPSTREPGRRGKQGETRARLIQVTIELVRNEGLSALTTGRITRAAGIAQPGFYAHFRNVDDLLRNAIGHVLGEMREKIRGARRRSFERLDAVSDAAQLDAVRAAYEDGLDVFLSDPAFAELFLRYRRDPSLLGGYMRRAMEGVRTDITEDMWLRARALGAKPQHHALIRFWADQVLALYFTAAEALLDDRYADRDMMLDALARNTCAMMNATIASLTVASETHVRPAQRAASGES
jgi:TetR/AcrR family transcriptional regulator, fatty acid biosynthesis regulator